MSGAISGARIKARRQQLGISPVELAAILSIGNVTDNHWENDRALPQASTIERPLRMELDGPEALRVAAPAQHDNLPLTFTGRTRLRSRCGCLAHQYPATDDHHWAGWNGQDPAGDRSWPHCPPVLARWRLDCRPGDGARARCRSADGSYSFGRA